MSDSEAMRRRHFPANWPARPDAPLGPALEQLDDRAFALVGGQVAQKLVGQLAYDFGNRFSA